MKINKIQRILLPVFLLFNAIPFTSSPQCLNRSIIDRSVTFAGISGDIDSYYQNLIVQDIALAGRKTFPEITLHFDFRVTYETDLCKPGQLNIRLFPLSMHCSPVFYQGYDISSSIIPEKADVVFHLMHKNGFVSDSLVFFDVSPVKDTGFYISITVERKDPLSIASVAFSNATLHFTQQTYDAFRDRILEIDHYYAAAFIADSVLEWAAHGFLAETDNLPEMISGQMEIERIIRFIRQDQAEIISGQTVPDIIELRDKYRALQRLNNRRKAIISYSSGPGRSHNGIFPAGNLLERYFDRLDYYYKLAYNTDFRYVQFIEDLAMINFTSASLASIHNKLSTYAEMDNNSVRFLSGLLSRRLIQRGIAFDSTGNRLRALKYYNAALDLSHHIHIRREDTVAGRLAARTKYELASSYIEISKKSVLTENPEMATQYFREALAIIDHGETSPSAQYWIREYEKWMMENFESQVVNYLVKQNYNKALQYLNEIQVHCLSFNSYPCPDRFPDWMKAARKGIYHDLLVKSRRLFLMEEITEAEQVFKQAADLRSRGGYRIEKEADEANLEVEFRQIRYEDLFEEGMRYYHRDQFSTSLYYFNEASFLERSSLARPRADLNAYRQAAARQIILQSLSEGRVSLWAHDFNGTENMLSQIKSMLADYGFAESDSLVSQYHSLQEKIFSAECEKVRDEFDGLLVKSNEAIAGQDFISALETAKEAVDLSMAHLDCRLNDGEAWYRKVNLEAPAEYQEMERSLARLVTVSCTDYIKFFQELKTYYNRHHLLEQNLVFIPLIDRVLRENDPGFLKGMAGYYMDQRDYERALLVLKRMSALEISPSMVAGEQARLAFSLARRDYARSAADEPWEILRSYTGSEKWFKKFSSKYKGTWMKESGWKLKYWPFLLKK